MQTDKAIKSCGVFCVRDTPERSFLLMSHWNRYDLPKGKMERGETEMDCALRELQEETGIVPDQVRIDPVFRYETVYYPRGHTGRIYEKVLVIFLGWVPLDVKIHPTEHRGYKWFFWQPPQQIQVRLVDDLLAAVAQHWAQNGTHPGPA